jgi:hypothetical protein
MHISKRTVAVAAAVAVAAGAGGVAYAVGLAAADDVPEAVTADTTFFVELDGAQEVPGPGDPDGSGFATVTIDTATDQVCVDFNASDIDPLTAMHIHPGPAGVAGPPAVNFDYTGPPTVDDRCVPGGAAADQIAANPLGYYLNAHTDPFPNGAIRGQLQPGALVTHVLPTPVRVYDSRQPNTLGVPALESGTTTVVDLTAGTDPALGALPPGATGALITVTITDTRDAGFLTVYSNALAAVPETSTINWVESNRDIAVTTTTKVDADGKVKVTIGPNGATDVIIDVLGYVAPQGVIAV